MQKSFPSADNIGSPVSYTIQCTLIWGNLKTQPSLIHSPDTQTAKNISDKCNFTFIINCPWCEQDDNYQQSLTSDLNSVGDSSNNEAVTNANCHNVDNIMSVADGAPLR